MKNTTRNRRLIAPLGLSLAAVVGATALSSNALFTSHADVDGNTFTAGTVDISTTPASTAFAVANMAPGDVVTKPITVRNDGSLNFRYAMESVATGALAPALTLQVKNGVTDCTNAGFDTSGTSLYGVSAPIGTSEGMKVLGDKAQGPDTGDRVLDAGASEVLCVQVTLPGASTGNDYQTQTADVAFHFYAEQTKNNGTGFTDDSTGGNTGGDGGSTVKPAAPSGVKVAVAGTTGYTLTWTDPAGVDGVYIYRSNDGGTTWTKKANIPAPTTTWTDTNPGTTPSYAIVSYTNSGQTSGNPGGDGSAGQDTPPPSLPASGTGGVLATGMGIPRGITYDTDNHYLYATNDAGAILKVDPATGTKTTLVASGISAQKGIAFNASDGNLYVTVGGIVTRVDPTTGAKTSTTASVSGSNTLTSDPKAGILYALSATTLYKVNLAAGTVTTLPVTIGATPYDSAYNTADGYLYAVTGAGGVFKVDLSTGATTAVATGIKGGARGLTYDTANGSLYASTFTGTSGTSGNIYKVNPETGDVSIAVASLSGTGHGITYNPDTGRLYANIVNNGLLNQYVP